MAGNQTKPTSGRVFLVWCDHKLCRLARERRKPRQACSALQGVFERVKVDLCGRLAQNRAAHQQRDSQSLAQQESTARNSGASNAQTVNRPRVDNSTPPATALPSDELCQPTRAQLPTGCRRTDTIILQLLLALPAASAMSAGVARSGRQLTVTVYSDFA